MSTIGLEEHFTTSEFRDAIQPFLQDTPNARALQAKLLNLGAERIAAMDKGAVDLQVLSLPSSGVSRRSRPTWRAAWRTTRTMNLPKRSDAIRLASQGSRR